MPKAIVHSHGGILIEQLKLQQLHLDLRQGDRMFFFTTTGWMMWNFLVSSLLIGVRPVLYDGSPTYPQAGVLWQLAQDCGVTFFGASPSYVDLMSRAGVVPAQKRPSPAPGPYCVPGDPGASARGSGGPPGGAAAAGPGLLAPGRHVRQPGRTGPGAGTAHGRALDLRRGPPAADRPQRLSCMNAGNLILAIIAAWNRFAASSATCVSTNCGSVAR